LAGWGSWARYTGKGFCEMFKKRSLKGSLRSKDGAEEEEEGEEEVKRGDLLDLRLEQEMRRRKTGVEIDAKTAAGGKASGSTTATLSSSSGGQKLSLQQFKAQTQSDIGSGGGGMAHEKIMESYVQEALGLNRNVDEDGSDKDKTMSAEERLYRVPAEIRALEGISSSSSGSSSSSSGGSSSKSSGIGAGGDDDSDLGIFAGIAEVALPIEFKLKNIEDTEAARRALEEKQRNKRGGYRNTNDLRNMSAQQFLASQQNQTYVAPVSTRFLLPHMRASANDAANAASSLLSSSASYAPTVAAPSVAVGAHGGESTFRRPPGERAPQKSNDDRTLENFKKFNRKGK